ncbi:MAG: PAS domain S-box protein, partial [Actinomycetes bacterium]
MSATDARDATGQVVGEVGSARDVDDAVRLETELAQALAQLSLVLDNTADVVARMGPDGTLLWASPSMKAAFGWDPEEVVGTRFRLAAPESQQELSDMFARAVADHADGFSARQRVACADGSLRWADTANTLVWAEDGGLDSMIVSLRDVTDQVIAQQALADRERVLQRMLENATDVVLNLAPDHTYRWVSPSVRRVLGWEPEQLVGKSGADMIHPDDFSKIIAARQLPDAGMAWVETFRYRQADGTYRWMSGTSREILDDDGVVQSRVVGLRDVDALVNARQETAEYGERYRLLAENASDMVWQLDTDGVIRWTSPSAGSASGWCPEQLLGRVAFDLIHRDDQPTLQDWRDRILAGSPQPPLTARMQTADGSFRWTSFRTQRTVDADGGVTGRVVGLRDVHEQVLAQQEVDVERNRLRATMDSLLDPHVLLDAVRDGSGQIVDFVYTDANDAACSYNGLERSALVGSRMTDLLPGNEGTGLLAQCTKVVETGEPLALDDLGYEHELLDDQTHYYDIRAVRVGDGLSYTWRDVTNRHNAASALAAAEYQYHLVAENATDAVFLVNPSGAFTWVSPSARRVLGYDPQDLVGMETTDLVHPEDLPVARSMVIQVQHGTQGVPWEARIRTASMDYRWMSAVSSPAFDPDGAHIGRITTLRDVHEQVLNRQSLARSEQTFRLAMEGAPQGMAVVGLHGLFQQVNATLCELVGHDQQWMNEHTEFDLMHPDEVEVDLGHRDRLLAGDAEYNIHEGRLVTASGNVLWVQHSLALVRDSRNMPLFYVSQYQDITDARAAQAVLAYKSEHDGLTGLINREQLQARLADVLARTPRQAGIPALLYCDLDHFKTVNDTLGHDEGD